jgi:hypothetical protein
MVKIGNFLPVISFNNVLATPPYQTSPLLKKTQRIALATAAEDAPNHLVLATPILSKTIRLTVVTS